jgi:ArsR family transcriptional regulator, arsenate/arsenite/antimonite-responsive transcriptional repressor
MRDQPRPVFSRNFDSRDALDLAGLLKAVADPARLQILNLLQHHGRMGPNEVTARLAAHIRLSQPTVSYHLKVLGEAGLLTTERDGHFMLRAVDEAGLTRLAGLLGGGR